jgi:DNA-directed RNA polymerase specialized sigma24 family protein
MRRAERDDEFAEFVGAHRSTLVSMGRLLTAGDQAWAEDLVQTTLTKL